MQRQLIQDLERYLQSLEDEEEKITALNAFRQILHEYSPFKSQPVDCVLWVKQDAVLPNDYNPNNLAPPEKRLLFTSLETDGFTQPIVVVKQDQERYLPVTCLEKSSPGRDSLMAATIRHNRARGRHQIHAMSEIVQELAHLGWCDEKIGKELGMDSDEVLRLKQINGLVEMFGDRQFSQAWTVK